jgi:hypothetical protein
MGFPPRIVARKEQDMRTHRDRDPLTFRWARSVQDTSMDPFDYSEGSAEPQRVIVEQPSFSRTCTAGHIAAWLVPTVITVAVVVVGLFTKGL